MDSVRNPFTTEFKTMLDCLRHNPLLVRYMGREASKVSWLSKSFYFFAAFSMM